mmetsp:Transcript_9744/g.59199  ORF Transcript_9744/g.59199 Transcript_9744/m.59199 type:complete len:91 (-) Transcript_9744:1554-1826(-)
MARHHSLVGPQTCLTQGNAVGLYIICGIQMDKKIYVSHFKDSSQYKLPHLFASVEFDRRALIIEMSLSRCEFAGSNACACPQLTSPQRED